MLIVPHFVNCSLTHQDFAVISAFIDVHFVLIRRVAAILRLSDVQVVLKCK